MATKTGATKAFAKDQPTNPWGSSLDKFKEWDPKGAETLLQVGTNPWTSGVLPRKEVELIYLALNCACTNLDEAGTRRHIRGALDAGATREEILTVFKMASLLALHSCSLGAPILLEEAKVAGVEPPPNNKVPTPSVMRQGARDRSMEYGLGSLFRPGPVACVCRRRRNAMLNNSAGALGDQRARINRQTSGDDLLGPHTRPGRGAISKPR